MMHKINHVEVIDAGIAAKRPYTEVVRKVFLTYPTHAFIGEEESQYKILNEVALFFDVQITSVQVTGSAKVGQSTFKKTSFVPGVSDLDLSVIDTYLFSRYQGIVLNITDGYKDLSKFKESNYLRQYQKYLAKGIFRPDLMPSCTQRADWFSFFGNLEVKHRQLFKSISANVCLSQCAFEWKQQSAIRNRAESEVVYD